MTTVTMLLAAFLTIVGVGCVMVGAYDALVSRKGPRP
jgi:hypothetical protein